MRKFIYDLKCKILLAFLSFTFITQGIYAQQFSFSPKEVNIPAQGGRVAIAVRIPNKPDDFELQVLEVKYNTFFPWIKGYSVENNVIYVEVGKNLGVEKKGGDGKGNISLETNLGTINVVTNQGFTGEHPGEIIACSDYTSHQSTDIKIIKAGDNAQLTVLPITLTLGYKTASWQKRELGSDTWETVSNTIDKSFTYPSLTKSTYFRRVINIYSFGSPPTETPAYSNEVLFLVGSQDDFNQIKDIAASLKTVPHGEEVTFTSKNNDNYTISATYQWQYKQSGDTEWKYIANETNYYLRQTMHITTTFRRIMIVNGQSYISNEVTVFVGEDPNIYLSEDKEFKQVTTYLQPSTKYTNPSLVHDLDYLDGFGRSVQSIAVNANSAANADIITPFQYGIHGRTEKAYLPYVKTANQGRYDANSFALSNWSTYGANEQAYAFTKIDYDNSPLNRVTKETGSGAAWHTDNKGVVTTYKINSPNRIYKWEVASDGSLLCLGYYPANTFQVIDKVNEDGIRTQTCIDSEGKIILDIVMISIINGEYWDTYYVYDMRGNLSYVLPPEAIVRVSSGTISTETLNEYAYCYKYDEWGRMIEKKLPGNAPIYYVYDKYDNLVLTQDGNQRSQTQTLWSYILYDNKHRIREKGIVDFSASYSRDELQQKANLMDNYSLGAEKRMIYEVYMYDNYNASHAFLAESGYSASFCPLISGQLTCRRVMDLSTDNFLFETYYYDDKMQLIQVVANNHMGGISRTTMAYDFVGNVIKTKERHTRPNATEDILETIFTYDNRGRLLSEKAVLNNTGVMEVAYTYDDLGRAVAKTYGSGNNSYKETFSYNIRNWLIAQNGNYFSMKLRYTDPQLGNKALYSGNISEWEWGHASSPTHIYGFDYDNVGRLKNASFYQLNGVNWLKSDRFTEKNITYDRQGNIKTLSRTNEADIKTFNYNYSGNRLSSVSGSLTGNYGYDANGNLISDSRRGFTLAYNRLNLLDNVKNGNMLLAKYSYRSDGIKQGVRDGNGENGFDYLSSLTYITTNGVTALEGAQFEDGIIRKNGNSYTTFYYLKDHLGSLRGIYNYSTTWLDFRYTYYPFGKRHGSKPYEPGDNVYGYNGKEEQVIGDLGYLDYGARMYDTELGRWLGVDPMAEEYSNLSPYNYVANNPIKFIDPNGMWVETDGGYTTTSSSDITRFLDALAVGSNFGSSSVSMDWMNNFVETEMSGLGMLGEDHWLLSAVGVTREINTHWTTDWESMYNAWSQVNFVLNGPTLDLTGHPVLPPLRTTGDKVSNLFSKRTYGIWDVGADGRITGITPRGGTAPTPGIKGGSVKNTAELVKKWLGKDAKMIINKKTGNQVFMSKDGLRKIRFDVNYPHGDKPHVHLEMKRNKNFRNAIPGLHRIYPK